MFFQKIFVSLCRIPTSFGLFCNFRNKRSNIITQRLQNNRENPYVGCGWFSKIAKQVRNPYIIFIGFKQVAAGITLFW